MEEENKQVLEEKKGLSITAMILGIVSIVLCKMVFLSVPCAILAIVFGVIENKKHKNGFAKSGFILGIISVIITIVTLIISISLYNSLFDTAKEASDKYKENKKSSIYDTTQDTVDNYNKKEEEKETSNILTIDGVSYESYEDYLNNNPIKSR